MDPVPFIPPSAILAIGWFYLVTNSARLITYIPQIIAVWRCRDGARAISLITWSSWVVSHAAAIAYGALVVHDAYFVFISSINCACSLVITCTAAQRRGVLAALQRWHARKARSVPGPVPAPPCPARIAKCRRAFRPDGGVSRPDSLRSQPDSRRRIAKV